MPRPQHLDRPVLLPNWLRDLLQKLLKLEYVLKANYTVQITNITPDTVFSEVDILYKRMGKPGVVFLQRTNLGPQESLYFDLGPCAEMESYVIAFFIGPDLVAQLPPAGQGNMTPALASTIKPSDQDRCADGWAIG